MKKLDIKKVKWNHYVNYAVVFAVLVVFAILSLTGNTKSSTEYLLEKLHFGHSSSPIK